VKMIRSHDHCLENLRRKSQRLAQELQDLKSLRDQVRSLEASDQRERRQDLAVPLRADIARPGRWPEGRGARIG
jgi:hypothetical protein